MLRFAISTMVVMCFVSTVAGQQIVDNSYIGTDYQSGFIATLGVSLDDPRSAQLKTLMNGNQKGVICGQISYLTQSGQRTPFTFFMADTTYKKLKFLSADNTAQIKSLCLPGNN